MVRDGELLWTPSAERLASSRLAAFCARHGFASYAEAWQASIGDLEWFWGSVWAEFDVLGHEPAQRVLAERSMPGAVWFPGATLNYAEHALRAPADAPAVVFRREDGLARELSYGELRAQVRAVAGGLAALGVGPGDRVVALLPNCPEALIALLATASLGAVWSSCSPDFGAQAVADRFAQIDPTVLIAVDGYRYDGRAFDVRPTVADLRGRLPGLRASVLLGYLDERAELAGTLPWAELARLGEPRDPVAVPFDHPLWILYSSGTTGLPKPIVHGHGGILLEHLKALGLHGEIRSGEVFFWFTTTGWMMWNYLVSGLLLGATVVLYDGSPGHPDLLALWRLAEATGTTYFGTSAPFLLACLKAGLAPASELDLTRLHTVGSTGAPLPAEGFGWAMEAVGAARGGDLHVASLSGGTDLCTGFVGPAAVLPVYAGELQCRMLGAAVYAYDEAGQPVSDRVGELVISEPMPSMPLYLWADPDGARLRESYFSVYPGVWRHGDWLRVTPRGSCVITGRSDATLNRGGVRMGTSEFYRVVEELAEVEDSLVVDVEGELFLFVVLAAGAVGGAELTDRLRREIRSRLSPRHVPDHVVEVAEVPRTLNGKKCEVPVKRILLGAAPEAAASAGALRNPDSLAPFARLGAQRAGRS